MFLLCARIPHGIMTCVPGWLFRALRDRETSQRDTACAESPPTEPVRGGLIAASAAPAPPERGTVGARARFSWLDLHLLGDLVMLVPLLRVLRRCHPKAHLGLMAGPWGQTILADTGLIDEFIPLRAPWVAKGQGWSGVIGLLHAIRASRRRAWDWGIDVRGDVRNALLLALARAGRRVAYAFSGGASLLTDVMPDDGVLRHIIDHHAALAAHLGMTMSEEERIPALANPRMSALWAHGSRRIGVHLGASMVLRRMPFEEACARWSSSVWVARSHAAVPHRCARYPRAQCRAADPSASSMHGPNRAVGGIVERIHDVPQDS